MKLPLVSRKKYEISENELKKIVVENLAIKKSIKELKKKNEELEYKLTESNEHIDFLENRIKELEFCLNDCKYENRQMIQKLKLTNIVKKQLSELTELKDSKTGKRIIEDKSVLVREKVCGVKVYNLARLLG